MTHSRRHALDFNRLVWAAALLVVVVAFSLILLEARGAAAGAPPEGEGVAPAGEGTAWALAPELAEVFRAARGQTRSEATGHVGTRYRLVGVLAAVEDGDAAESGKREAIVESRAEGRQRRIAAGAQLDADYRVLQVEDNAVLVEGRDGVERLERAEAGTALAQALVAKDGGGTATDGAAVLARFHGKQLSPTRWEFSREAMLGYYRELMDQPDRLVQVFDSLRPLYNATRQIEGYQLHVAGEADFFAAVGLQEGDVVRAVNSLPMTNRRRAEQFIRRFATEGLDTVVLDIERGGTPVKQVYLTR